MGPVLEQEDSRLGDDTAEFHLCRLLAVTKGHYVIPWAPASSASHLGPTCHL